MELTLEEVIEGAERRKLDRWIKEGPDPDELEEMKTEAYWVDRVEA